MGKKLSRMEIAGAAADDMGNKHPLNMAPSPDNGRKPRPPGTQDGGEHPLDRLHAPQGQGHSPPSSGQLGVPAAEDCEEDTQSGRTKDRDSNGWKDKDSNGTKDRDSDGTKDRDSNGTKDRDSDGTKDKDSDGGKDRDSDGTKDRDSNGTKDRDSDGIKDKGSYEMKGGVVVRCDDGFPGVLCEDQTPVMNGSCVSPESGAAVNGLSADHKLVRLTERKTAERSPCATANRETVQISVPEAETDIEVSAEETDIGHSAEETDIGHSAEETDTGHSAEETDIGDSVEETDIADSADEIDMGLSAEETDIGDSADERDVFRDSLDTTNADGYDSSGESGEEFLSLESVLGDVHASRRAAGRDSNDNSVLSSDYSLLADVGNDVSTEQHSGVETSDEVVSSSSSSLSYASVSDEPVVTSSEESFDKEDAVSNDSGSEGSPGSVPGRHRDGNVSSAENPTDTHSDSSTGSWSQLEADRSRAGTDEAGLSGSADGHGTSADGPPLSPRVEDFSSEGDENSLASNQSDTDGGGSSESKDAMTPLAFRKDTASSEQTERSSTRPVSQAEISVCCSDGPVRQEASSMASENGIGVEVVQEARRDRFSSARSPLGDITRINTLENRGNVGTAEGSPRNRVDESTGNKKGVNGSVASKTDGGKSTGTRYRIRGITLLEDDEICVEQTAPRLTTNTATASGQKIAQSTVPSKNPYRQVPPSANRAVVAATSIYHSRLGTSLKTHSRLGSSSKDHSKLGSTSTDNCKHGTSSPGHSNHGTSSPGHSDDGTSSSDHSRHGTSSPDHSRHGTSSPDHSWLVSPRPEAGSCATDRAQARTPSDAQALATVDGAAEQGESSTTRPRTSAARGCRLPAASRCVEVKAGPDDEHVCPTCGNFYPLLQHIEAHCLEHPVMRSAANVRCGGCGAQFHLVRSLDAHLRRSVTATGFRCRRCRLWFRTCDDLYRHAQAARAGQQAPVSVLDSGCFRVSSDRCHRVLSRY